MMAGWVAQVGMMDGCDVMWRWMSRRGGTGKGIGARGVWKMISARMFGQIALWGCLLMLMGLVDDIGLDCGKDGDHEKESEVCYN
jgi:hypothetical protein